MEAAEEAALVAGLRAGDATAFDRVYAAYRGRIFAFLLRLARRRDTAEDLAQETWIRLARAAPRLAESTRLAPLLFTIARNAHVSHRRWAMLDLSRLVLLGIESAAAVAEPPDEVHDRARSMARLERALGELPLPSREVLLLVAVEGLEQEEAATVLGISYDATRQRLHRARTQLAEAMERLERAPGERRKGGETA